MPRPRGAKNKEKRKSRRNQPSFRAEANALADFLGVRPPSGANIPKPPPVQVVNEVSPVSRANVPSNAEEDASRAEEDDDSVQLITGIEAKGTIDPQGIEADFDDGRPAGAGSGYMKLPFLPVNGKDEFRVFSRIMLRADFARFDSEQMAHLWMEYVNGYTVYPKLPSQLREYHKAWERNKRIKRAEERMKTDSEMLKSFLESKVPIEIEERRSLAVSENEYQQNLYSQESGRITLPEARLPNQFPVVLPYYFRLQPHEPRPTVGNIPMLVALAPTVMGGAAKRRGERLKDKKSRKKRRCGTCLTLEKGNSTALQCPGRSRPAYCPNIHSLPA
ncbi:hypothetical protein IV203_013596 [Nitzschia inconspicua]|uniref:Uncharacterized protein n=1 Tax=Nitzschia inconspicua TaxID=303405 RepID=A0A9K3Q852_9STRA|nr:hypothetical protein IV203_013596 [Nitzschia inconspicua]